MPTAWLITDARQALLNAALERSLAPLVQVLGEITLGLFDTWAFVFHRQPVVIPLFAQAYRDLSVGWRKIGGIGHQMLRSLPTLTEALSACVNCSQCPRH